MNVTDYDQHLPQLLTLANHIAADLDRISTIPVVEITRSQPDHHDGHLDDGTQVEPAIIWRGYGRLAWTTEQHNMIPATAQWLRNDLPRLAATLVGTNGVDIDDTDNDRCSEFVPEDVEEILTSQLILDADGQTSYWRPEDKDHASYGALIYKATAAETFLAAWNAFVNRVRYTEGELRGRLELASARLDRDADLVADLAARPNETQASALKNLKTAVGERNAISSKLAAADEKVAVQVRACLGVGVSAIKLADELHVTRARIYQIRDGRR